MLSKSKLIAYRQCPRKFWLNKYRPEVAVCSDDSVARIETGYLVGDLARKVFDPVCTGQTINLKAAHEQTKDALLRCVPIFEASVATSDAQAFADVLLPLEDNSWHLIEVKSASSVKDYHREDVVAQAFIFKQAGVKLSKVSIAVIDSDWGYDGNYNGIFKLTDVSEETFARIEEVGEWIVGAQAIEQGAEPLIPVGKQCVKPFKCEFMKHCGAGVATSEFPVSWLPNVKRKDLKEHLSNLEVRDLHDVPDELLNVIQQRVKASSLAGTVFHDATVAKQHFAKYSKQPIYFLDFETIVFVVPIWQSTRPYQQIPFQFSCHRVGRSGKITDTAFVDVSGNDPREALTLALIDACQTIGPIFAYNSGFEAARIRELAVEFPSLAKKLKRLARRLVDLTPIVQSCYYHPSQHGSFSLKAVLPALVPELSYTTLAIQNGGEAQVAYLEAFREETTGLRKQEIRQQLLDYCRMDTFGPLRMWQQLIQA